MDQANCFIKAAEIWLPVSTPALLEFGGGWFGPAQAFEHRTRSMCFGRAEGLPGRAWDESRPVLFADLDRPEFRRAALARAVNFTCAVALPFFGASGVEAVVTLFCGHARGHASALELWMPDEGRMTLADGAYPDSMPGFAAASRASRFAPGVGLPGRAWQAHSAIFVADLAADGGFVRTTEAQEAGLIRGLALPFGGSGGGDCVVTLLTGPGLPIARRIERWVPDDECALLRRDWAFSELHDGASPHEATLPLPRHYAGPAGVVGRAWLTGVPAISGAVSAEPGPLAAAAAGVGAGGLVALPIVRGMGNLEVLALYL